MSIWKNVRVAVNRLYMPRWRDEGLPYRQLGAAVSADWRGPLLIINLWLWWWSVSIQIGQPYTRLRHVQKRQFVMPKNIHQCDRTPIPIPELQDDYPHERAIAEKIYDLLVEPFKEKESDERYSENTAK